MTRIQVQSILMIIIVCYAYCQDRKITSIINPGRESSSQNSSLVYVIAEGSHDIVHQIWDFTRGIPTVIFIITSLNTTINVTWNGLVPIKFDLSNKPLYSFALAIDQLYEYNDLEDNGHIDLSCPSRSYSLLDQLWHLNNVVQTEKEVMVLLHSQYKNEKKDGIIEIKLDLLPFKDYAVELPHLIHTANSTLVDVSLVNLTTTRKFNSSRFALHILLVSSDDPSESMHYTMRKSLDDEHTPGIFEIIEIKTPETYKKSDGGFIQFRPVAYRQRDRSVTTSTKVHVSDFNRTNVPQHSTIDIFYNSWKKNILVQDMFVSFGETGDKFYTKYNYTAWSFTIGYGSPPVESFSMFVILIISIGLGVPIALALSGITYVIIKRKKHSNTPSRFTDDD